MHVRGIAQRVVSGNLAMFLALAALTACARTVQPPVPDQTPASYELLAGEWHSTMTDSLHLEGILPEHPMPEVPWSAGWTFRFRARCAGTGALSFSVRGKSFRNTYKAAQCTGKWQLDGTAFPPFVDDGTRDLGPYTVSFDAEPTVTSWDVEAYATRISNAYGTATPSPTGPTVTASAAATP
ncbi:hypothetical protein AB0H83_33295 [Dactylosporangium sp. NPDC050688]|uniref:hypothetical protein n=1 Tax=Dactylosporangium sp. NPDC050688 TaxID=3157217 RepID=UPI0033EC48B5